MSDEHFDDDDSGPIKASIDFPSMDARGKQRCNVLLTRSDGYMSSCDGLSYEGGLAVEVLIMRVAAGLPVTLVYEQEGQRRTVDVPAAFQEE